MAPETFNALISLIDWRGLLQQRLSGTCFLFLRCFSTDFDIIDNEGIGPSRYRCRGKTGQVFL